MAMLRVGLWENRLDSILGVGLSISRVDTILRVALWISRADAMKVLMSSVYLTGGKERGLIEVTCNPVPNKVD